MDNTIASKNKQPKAYKIFMKIDKWTFALIEKFIVATSLIGLTMMVFFLIVLRYLGGISPEWSDELPRYLMVWLTFIGMAYCVRCGEHVAIDFVVQGLKGSIKKTFYVGILILCFFFSLVILFYGYALFLEVLMSGQKSVSLDISMAYVYVSIPIGAFLMAKNFLHLIILNFISKDVVFSFKEGEAS